MLHHISLQVSDLEASARLYDAMLFSLQYIRAWTAADAIGYGLESGKDKFSIKKRGSSVVAPGEGFHLAFSAQSREDVDNFYEAALKFGAKDNGPPGLRPHYADNYYAAFVIDLDGYQIEAVYK